MVFQALKKKYVGLDLFRVVCALATCAFHTWMHLGASYGIFTSVIQMGAIFMTAFFMLSGFTLFTNYASTDLTKKESLKTFWIKRMIGILPMYYIASVLYVLYGLTTDPSAVQDTVIQNLWLAPIEALCLQSTFSSLFSLTHNGGTWFISCVMLCYFAYPFLQELVKQLSVRSRVVILVLCAFILLYAPITVRKFEIATIYSNPFFRILEFLIGMVLASLKIELDEVAFVKKYVYNWLSLVLVSVFMAAGVTVAVKLGIATGDYMMYSWICLPCFMFILFGISGIKAGWLEKSKLFSYCSGIAYVFFLAQLFSNSICKIIIAKYAITNNLMKIALGWGVCILLAVGFHELLEKPITKVLKKLFLRG